MPVDHAILLAYGPRRTTSEAVERLKAVVAPTTRIVVVAAIRQAARPLGALRSARVEVERQVGREGLRRALDVPADDTVLVLHDDVLLPAASLEALADCHRGTRRVVTAWSNDTGQPNFVGALPPVGQAGAAIAAVAPDVGEKTVATVRSACLLATASTLRALLPMRLTVARTLLRSTTGDLVVASGAVVAHDSTCLDQVARPRSPDDRPLVTAALIVRDEEDMLPGCLDSLEGLADRIVVCDTGSTDRTVEIARAHGAEIMTREWRHDFGWARNEVLDACRDSWYVLQIDADERLRCDPDEIRRLLATDVDDSAAFTIQVDNLGSDGQAGVSHLATRLFRPDGITYVGALHEMPTRTDGCPLVMTRLDGVELEHHGYTAEIVQARGKQDRNVDIARHEHATSPTPLTAMNLARALISTNEDPAEIGRLLTEAVDDGLPTVPRAHALALLANLSMRDGDPERARRLATEALELVPAEDAAGQAHAEASLALGDTEGVIRTAAVRRTTPSADAYSESAVARARELLAVARAHVAQDDLVGAEAAVARALTDGRVRGQDAWLDVVSILTLADPGGGRDRLVAAAATDPSGEAIEAVKATLPGVEAARIATQVVATGTVTPAAVRIGLAAAIVTADRDALSVLVPHAHLVDPAVVERLMEVAATKGRAEVAGELARQLLATTG